TLAPKLSRADAWIDTRATADECRRRVNALSPWPGVQATLAGVPLKLLRADAEQPGRTLGEPGALLAPAAVLVARATAALRPLAIQPAGKRPRPWQDFARGRAIAPGAMLTPITGPGAC